MLTRLVVPGFIDSKMSRVCLQDEAARCIRNLSSSDSCQPDIVAENAIQPLVELLDVDRHSTRMQENAAMALANLAHNTAEYATAIALLGAPGRLVARFDNLVGDVRVRT